MRAGRNQRFSGTQVAAFLLLPFALTALGMLYVVVIALQGRPFIFASERMCSPERAFKLYKIRTMHPPDPLEAETVLSGSQAWRVTAIGAFLRRSRLDELPQIFNVIRGDIRFIGPRPPLRRYVEAYPDLYERVLRDTPPGITGLATVMLHRREERLLSRCRDAHEADRVYRTRCIPIKARLDLIYCDRRSVGLNAMILVRTLSRLSLASPGRRTSPLVAANRRSLGENTVGVMTPVRREAA
ncbi:MAG: sugar transferase [Silicimonas sp.]|nr:sugar transferase [Silicimonas sp.]